MTIFIIRICQIIAITFFTFVSKYSNKIDHFSLIHFNARCLPQNFDKFANYLNLLQFPFTIIGVSETWLTINKSALCELENYNLITCNRINRQGGGVALYIKVGVKVRIRSISSLVCYFDS